MFSCRLLGTIWTTGYPNVSSGVARIWCERGHDNVRNIRRNITKLRELLYSSNCAADVPEYVEYATLVFLLDRQPHGVECRSLCGSGVIWKIKQLDVERRHHNWWRQLMYRTAGNKTPASDAIYANIFTRAWNDEIYTEKRVTFWTIRDHTRLNHSLVITSVKPENMSLPITKILCGREMTPISDILDAMRRWRWE